MYLSYVRGRSLVNITGLFLAFILLVLFYIIWMNDEVSENSSNNKMSINPLASDTFEFPSNEHSDVVVAVQKTTSTAPSIITKKSQPDPGGERTFNPSLTCFDRYPLTRRETRGKFWVLYNYIRPTNKNYSCDESITYTTHGDYTFNDNLIPLLERWRGPVSMAIYAPGYDFYNAIKSIYYYRHCLNSSSLVEDYATFHLFFDIEHLPFSPPAEPPRAIRDFTKETSHFNCKAISSEVLSSNNQTLLYKHIKKLTYPVNVGRNIARLEAVTHFIFPSDVELYPSPGLIPAFISMIKQNKDPALRGKSNPRVFVNSIFEVKRNIRKIPESKPELLDALDSGDAIPFHKKVCSLCHSIPNSKEWNNRSTIQDEMRIFYTAKRVSPFQHWEPIYIGTNEDPLYDERLSWEGRSDKMTQGYQLCLQDYDFHILNNAFLIHRPGIKVMGKTSKNTMNQISKQNQLIRVNISQELDVLYGTKEGCRLY